MALAILSVPHILAVQILYLPNLDSFLAKLDLSTTGLQESIKQTIALKEMKILFLYFAYFFNHLMIG